MSKIGIFWVHQNTVIGKSRDLCDGEENVPGLLDSPDSHVDLWEQDSDIMKPFPELLNSEYQDVPRGRVIHSTRDRQTIVYLDQVLLVDPIKQKILDFFHLNPANTLWRTDKHYTTDSRAIDRLFDEPLY